MPEQVKKHKTEDEMSMDELHEVVSARRNGKPTPKFMTDEYRKARREALEDAGLDPDDEPGEPVAAEDMTPDQHLARIQEAKR
jgi:hypothetical protein